MSSKENDFLYYFFFFFSYYFFFVGTKHRVCFNTCVTYRGVYCIHGICFNPHHRASVEMWRTQCFKNRIGPSIGHKTGPVQCKKPFLIEPVVEPASSHNFYFFKLKRYRFDAIYIETMSFYLELESLYGKRLLTKKNSIKYNRFMDSNIEMRSYK